MTEAELTTLQTDALRELANIGVGNAVTSLSELTGSLVTLEVPDVRLVPLAQVGFLLGSPEMPAVGVSVGFEGDIQGRTLLVLAAADAWGLGTMLLGDQGAEEGLMLSAAAETGNILTAAYLGAVEMLTGLSAVPTVPAVAADMAGALLTSVVAQQGEIGDEALLLDARFVAADRELQGRFLLLPAPGALAVLLAAMGVA